MTTWPLVPNWSSALRETYEFRTEVLTSRSGAEQRLALRTTPRRSIAFAALADQARLRDLDSLMAATRGASIMMPEFVRGVRTTSALPALASAVTVSDVPAWLVPGRQVAVSAHRNLEPLTVEAVAGLTVTFETPAAAAWPQSALLSPLAPGWLAKGMQSRLKTNAHALLPVDFVVEPGVEAPLANPADAAFSFKGREVFMARPNWATSPTVIYDNSAEEVDYGRGRVARFLPIDFATRTHQATYLRRSRADADYFVNFFLRAKGQRGEFYHPTWQDDLPPMTDLAGDAATLVVKGRAVFDRYATDPVHRAVGVITKSGVLVARAVESITLVGGNSVLTMTQPWGSDRPRASILMVCWMPVCRFASDSLTVEWETDQVAQITASTRTLEDTPPEASGVTLDGAAEYLISTYGWSFTETTLVNPLHWAMNVRLPEIFA